MAKNHFFKARWKSLAGILLLFVVIVTVIAVSPLTDASAASSGSDMTITENLVLEWRTDSTGNKDLGRHFETTYWTFSVYKEGSSKVVGTVKVPVSIMLNEKGTSSDGFTMAYKWKLKDKTAKGYTEYAKKLVDLINKVDGDVIIIANPTIDFYTIYANGTKTVSKTVTTYDAANDYADEFFYHNGKKYFENYFNKNVEIEAVRIRVKTKAGDDDSYNGINIESGTTIDEITVSVDKEATNNAGKKTKISESVWYQSTAGKKPEIVVKTYQGYVFTGAESTSSVSVSMETTAYGNGSGKTGKLTTNTTIAVEADPVKVKLVYYIDEDGSGNYVKAGSDTCVYAHMDGGAITIGNGTDESICDLNYYTTWTYMDKDGKEQTYNSRDKIDNTELYDLWKATGDLDTVTHTVNLYAESSNPPADSDYKIVYDGNGATSGSMTDQYATYGTTTMLKTNAYLKTGYHTDKDDTWISEKNSVYYAEAQSVSDATLDFDDDDKTVVTQDANWKPNECTIVYNGNGATSGTVKKQTITYDDWTTTLQENKFSKTGTSFDTKLSWNTEPDGSGTTFAPGTVVKEKVWKQLFGSADANGVRITLYAIWGDTPTTSDTPRETWELASLGGGQLTYVNPLDNDTDGPYAYEWTGSLSLLACMFGTKYDTATTEYVTYDTGFQTTMEQQMFMITAGSTIYKGDADEDWYKFEGWSVDEYAQYGDSDSILLAAGQTMSREDLGAYAMAYKYPIKYNSKWDTMTLDEMMESGGVPVPTSTSLPSTSDLSGRANVISEAAKAWKTYKSLLESEVVSSTTEYSDAADAYDDAKAAYEETVDTYEAAKTAYNSAVSYRDSVKSQKPTQYYYITKDGDVTYIYSSGCKGPYVTAAYSSWYTRYSIAQSNVSSTKSAMNNAKTKMNHAEDEMDEAEEEMNTWESRVDGFTDTYNFIIEQINNTISDTKLYAVWDKFPVFEDMDEIAINEVDITGIDDLAEWLWQYVTVTDREDITLTNGTDVVLENKDTLIAELQQLEHTGSVSVTFRATDSAGNVTKYTTNIWMNDKDPLQTNVLAERINFENGYTRFISREYYELGNPDNFSSEQEYLDRYVNATGLHTNEDGSTTVVPYYLYCGGLHPNSKWYTAPEYKAEILNMFENEENGTPEEVWTFTYDDIQDIKTYIDTYGIGDTYGEGRLKNFYNKFKHCCTVYKQPFQDIYSGS